MTETQITDITVKSEDLSHFDTGGGTRLVKALINIDSTLPRERQREVVIHETLGVYLGILVSRVDIEEIAQAVNDALYQWEDSCLSSVPMPVTR